MIKIETGIYYTQAFGCRLCLHIGSVAIYFGRKSNGRGPRIEICTPSRWFRYSRGYVNAARAAGIHSVPV